jgi:hypothetical protein
VDGTPLAGGFLGDLAFMGRSGGWGGITLGAAGSFSTTGTIVVFDEGGGGLGVVFFLGGSTFFGFVAGVGLGAGFDDVLVDGASLSTLTVDSVFNFALDLSSTEASSSISSPRLNLSTLSTNRLTLAESDPRSCVI